MPAASSIQAISGQSFTARMQAFAAAQKGWRRAALAFAAGSVSVLAFAPIYASPVLFVTFALFVWLIDSAATPKDAAFAGWWFGFGYFFFNLFWIGEAFLVEADKFAWLLPFAITLLPAGLALFWALAAWISRRLWPEGFARVLVFAVAFSIAEWLRGHLFTGLPWNVPGYALTAPLVLMQSAGLFGIYGLTLIALVIFSGPLVLLSDAAGAPRPWAQALALAAIPLAAMSLYGAWQLSVPQTFAEGVKLRIVQPSVLQTQKWRPEHQRRIFEDHLTLSQTNASGQRDHLEGITHVVWPEAAMPFFPLESKAALEAIAAMLPDGRMLITGAIRRQSEGEGAAASVHVFNSILVFDAAAKLTGVYDKIHLVPFGEYLPAAKFLNAIGLQQLAHNGGVFEPGTSPRPLLAVPGLPPIACLICYEALFPNEVVQSAARPGVILNVTNDGWFGNSSGPRQHFQQTRVRAVEQGVPVVRAANNGISGVIDAHGRVLGALWIDERGVIDSPLPAAGSPPPYALWGDLIFAALTVLAAGAALAKDRKYGR